MNSNDLLEQAAQRFASIYNKRVTGHTMKWERLSSDERSVWRLIARAAEQEFAGTTREEVLKR